MVVPLRWRQKLLASVALIAFACGFAQGIDQQKTLTQRPPQTLTPHFPDFNSHINITSVCYINEYDIKVGKRSENWSGPLDMSEENLKRVREYNEWLDYVAEHTRHRKFTKASFPDYDFDLELSIFESLDFADAPYHAQLINYNDGSFCGGAAIGPRLILTAAHCLKNLHHQDMKLFVIKMGSVEKELGEALRISGFILHEKWLNYATQDEQMSHDIALIFTKDSINNRNIISLASRAERVGDEGRILGYEESNKLEHTLRYPDILREASVKILPGRLKGVPTVFFTSDLTGKGDRGGPFVWKEGDKYVLGGIQSAIVPLADGTTLRDDTVHHQIIRVRDFKDWIDFHIKKSL
ncbi:trypsin domain-containing protein [Ditylenchus destructor]|nr:trypsin domain-containing protein [Ditylenchus destructor]